MFQCPVRLGLTGAALEFFRTCCRTLMESKSPRHRHPEQLYRILDHAGLGEPGGARDVERMDQIRFEATGDRPEQKLERCGENQGQGRSDIFAGSEDVRDPITQKVAIILKDKLLPRYFKRRYVWIPTMHPPADFAPLGRRILSRPRCFTVVPPTRRRIFTPLTAPTQIRPSGLLSPHRDSDRRV